MPLTKWQPPAHRHLVADDGRVTWLELFFDLVYVAALIQLGDRLVDDISWRGIAAFVGAFVVLWWTWTGTTTFTNRFAVDDITHRVLGFAQMFAVGNLAVLAASRSGNWQVWFVFAYVAARLPLIAMYVRAMRSMPDSRALAVPLVRAYCAGITIWLISLAVPGNARYVVWVVALAVEFAVPVVLVRQPTVLPGHAEHLQERYALFTIIVLGETFVKTLTAIVDRGISIETQVYGGIGFVMLIAIWWTYFDDVADAHIRPTSAVSSTSGTNRLVWVYTHLPLTAAITAFGVAAKKVVSVDTFSDALKANYTWLLVGALIVVLLSVAILDLVTASPHYAINAPERVGPRLVAAAALAIVGAVVVSAKPSALIAVTTIACIVVAQIAVEVVAAHKSEHRVNQHVRDVISAAEGSCTHLDAAMPPPPPRGENCEVCVAAGADPVQLRWCLDCAHVGCCDDTPGQHARQHHLETGHTMIGSLERGDTWAYCYLHDVSVADYIEPI